MKLATRALLCLWLLITACQSQGAIQASVDRNRVSLGDSITLTLRPDAGEDLDDVDFSELEASFIIAGTSSNSQIRLFNGQREIVQEKQLSLFPRREGILRIPALGEPGASSRPISIMVEEAPVAANTDEDLYVEAGVNRETTWVQGQLVYTFRLFQALDLEERPKLTPLVLDNASIEELETKSFQRQIKGRSFLVTELRYAIFPERSGQLEIPSLTLSARVRDPSQSRFTLGKRGILVRRETPALTVEVKPVPAAYPDATWLPLEKLDIEESWSADPRSLKPGDSITRTITLRGKGLAGEQLPAIDMPAGADLKVYMDQPRTETLRDDAGLTGLGISSAAILVTAAGRQELPAIRIPWWDMNAGRLRYAELPATTLQVAPTTVPIGSDATTEPATTDTPFAAPSNRPSGRTEHTWMWVSAGLLLAWLTTLLGWMQSRRSTRPSIKPEPLRHDSSKALKSLLSNCKRGDAVAAREDLRAWAQAFFQLDSKPSLDELTALSRSAELRQEIEELDQALFRDAERTWNGTALGNLLTKLQKIGPQTLSSDARLEPLN